MTPSFAITDIFAYWQRGIISSLTRPASGFIHQTWLAATSTGAFALRRYRYQNQLPIQREHALIIFVQAHGLPAVGPLPLPTGETILRYQDAFYALFPFAPGYHLFKDELTIQAVSSMGRFLAALHNLLALYPHDQVNQRQFHLDSITTLAQIQALVAKIQALPMITDFDVIALKRLAGQQKWVEEHQKADAGMLNELPQQVIHGDYTETNIFFDQEQVGAIIDWDQAYVAPRAWEVVRTFDLVFSFASEPCRLFLAAYDAIAPLDRDELDVAAKAYATMRAHDLWMCQAIYEQGNERVKQFLSPQGFVPLDQQWRKLQKTL